jgi:DNA gyrase inhibitor GyrI
LAVEEPAFRRTLQDGAFEIREYPELLVAEVAVNGGQKAAVSSGFRLLAGYIFGANRQRRKISMTAPVTQIPTGETVELSSPAVQIEQARRWLVRFTMPAGSSLATLPPPNDPAVHLTASPAERVAVVRFSGLAEPADVARRTQDLNLWMQKHSLHPSGSARLAQYDPPWTLWFMRRNEVMIPIGS